MNISLIGITVYATIPITEVYLRPRPNQDRKISYIAVPFVEFEGEYDLVPVNEKVRYSKTFNSIIDANDYIGYNFTNYDSGDICTRIKFKLYIGTKA